MVLLNLGSHELTGESSSTSNLESEVWSFLNRGATYVMDASLASMDWYMPRTMMGEVGVVWWAMQKLLMMDDWEVWEVLEVEFVSGVRNVFVMNVFMVESSAVFCVCACCFVVWVEKE